ncbi:MAG TPA: DUF4235 domain-containing protein [Pseudonocardiaceae bacterium]
MSKVNAALYKPFGMLFSVLGGVASGVLFKWTWKRITGEEEAPGATQGKYGWREVLLAAALQGAIFGLVKAAIDRAGAAGYRKVTGRWPGD